MSPRDKLIELLREEGTIGVIAAERIADRIINNPGVVAEAIGGPAVETLRDLVKDRDDLFRALGYALLINGPVMIPDVMMEANPRFELHQEPSLLESGTKLYAEYVV